MAIPKDKAREFVVRMLAEQCDLPEAQFNDDDAVQDYITELHLPELATLINDEGWHHVLVTVPEVAACDKIKNLVDLVAKKGS